jgi:thymidine kinase
MAQLYFYYSAMNAGKSTMLLQSSHNYHERGMRTLLFTPKLDNRYAVGRIHSRIGLESEAMAFTHQDNLLLEVKKQQEKPGVSISCVLVDEAQFLSREQVGQLTDICDQLNIPVLAYGLRTDFRGELFEGSQYLLAMAENLVEIKTVCHCGRKAIMNLRIDHEGKVVSEGLQVHIGGNEAYVSTCRRHFKQRQPHAVLAKEVAQ